MNGAVAALLWQNHGGFSFETERKPDDAENQGHGRSLAPQDHDSGGPCCRGGLYGPGSGGAQRGPCKRQFWRQLWRWVAWWQFRGRIAWRQFRGVARRQLRPVAWWQFRPVAGRAFAVIAGQRFHSVASVAPVAAVAPGGSCVLQWWADAGLGPSGLRGLRLAGSRPFHGKAEGRAACAPLNLVAAA